MNEMQSMLARQMAVSKATFGPGRRTTPIIKHMRMEMEEVYDSDGDPAEWVDLVILALDGLTRAVWVGSDYKMSADRAALMAEMLLREKYAKNERRDWPDWRKANPLEPIEHIKGKFD